jgi:CheY-like chemotaxis protein
LKILVAEDEPHILELYKIVLELHKHEVSLTSNGAECLRIYFEEARKQHGTTLPFDVLLLDYRMPEKDGLQVATEILSKYPRQKIVMASAFASEIIEGLTKAVKNSIKVLEQPVEFENLLQIVESQAAATGSSNANLVANGKGQRADKSGDSAMWLNENLKEEMK